MRNCSKTDLQVTIVCQNCIKAESCRKKYTTSENCKDPCIVLFSSVLVFIIPHSTGDIYTSGHIQSIADT